MSQARLNLTLNMGLSFPPRHDNQPEQAERHGYALGAHSTAAILDNAPCPGLVDATAVLGKQAACLHDPACHNRPSMQTVVGARDTVSGDQADTVHSFPRADSAAATGALRGPFWSSPPHPGGGQAGHRPAVRQHPADAPAELPANPPGGPAGLLRYGGCCMCSDPSAGLQAPDKPGQGTAQRSPLWSSLTSSMHGVGSCSCSCCSMHS